MKERDDATALVIEAAGLHAAGRQADAIALLIRARAAQPGRADVHFNLGRYLVAAGDLGAALAAFEAALACRPDWAEARLYLAAHSLEAGKVEAAIGLLEEGQRIHPGDAGIQAQLRVARMRREPASRANYELLLQAGKLETAGDFAGAAALCEQTLGDAATADHFFALARNRFQLAAAGNDLHAWGAAMAAMEGLGRRVKELGQGDAEFALGIVDWALDHFADWHRLDVPSSYMNAAAEDSRNGAPVNETMTRHWAAHSGQIEAGSDPMVIANSLYRLSPPVLRAGRAPDGIAREARYAFACQFAQLRGHPIEDQIRGAGLPLPGGFEFQTYDRYLLSAARAEMKYLQARARGVPSILLTCLPKSASEFLCYTLADTLGAAVVRASVGDPLLGPVFDEWIREILKGGCVLHDHFGAWVGNSAVLSACGVKRIHVLVRDPRAAAFSLHNMEQETGLGEATRGHHLEATRGFRLFPGTVSMLARWIEKWLAARAFGIEVEFIRFRQLVADPLHIMSDVLRAAGATGFETTLEKRLADRSKGANFRTGDDDAWRATVPSEVAEQAWQQIPVGVRELLGLES